MGTGTGTAVNTIGVEVDVDLMKKTATLMTHNLINLTLRTVHNRGLEPGYVQDNYKVLEDGFRIWLGEQKLEAVQIQVHLPGAPEALENWISRLNYLDDANLEVRRPPIEQIEEACRALRTLPPGAVYRVFVYLGPNATRVAGWAPATPLPITVAEEKEIGGEWGFGRASGRFFYQGSSW